MKGDKSQYLKDLELDTYETYKLSELKKQYHRLAKKYHPDSGGDEFYFKKVNHAYNMLTNPDYNYRHSSNNTPPNLNLMLNIAITFEQGFFGDTLTIALNPTYIDQDRRPIVIDKERDIFLDVEVIKLTIPPGTSSGEQFCVKEKGLCYAEGRGDLIVSMNVKDHPIFKIKTPDIVSIAKIPLDLMLKGGSFDVTTMYGVRTLEVPPGTRPNTELRIPHVGIQKIGHQIVIIQPEFPSQDDLKNNPVWKSFGINWGKYENKEKAPIEAIDSIWSY